jgi:23S rRNA (adenine-N6)-dimethyltransferase
VAGRRPDARRGAHFLLPAVAADLVRSARVRRDELVLDLGAGTGALTAPLADTGARVLAVEREPASVRRLQRRFAGNGSVRVVHGDVLRIPLPHRPFRVVANIPFGVTTELLRRLLDQANPLAAADLVVAAGVCTALTSPRPGNRQVLRWSVRYELSRGKALGRGCFRPAPSVDAAVLVVRRRTDDLVRGPERAAYLRLIDAGLHRAGTQWSDACRGALTRRQLVRVAAERDLDPRASAATLGSEDWAALARLVCGTHAR